MFLARILRSVIRVPAASEGDLLRRRRSHCCCSRVVFGADPDDDHRDSASRSDATPARPRSVEHLQRHIEIQ